MNAADIPVPSRRAASPSLSEWLACHWFQIFLVIFGLWVWIPFLAPVFMNIGWSAAGKAIYFVYSFFCHQLPERSFFLFGQNAMYSLTEIQAAWQETINPLILRRFIGNEELGWKIAWSDRMISFYTSIWLFAIVWWPFRHKVKQLRWWAFAFLLLPIVLDGGTHMLSDLAGIGQGFRDSNEWLILLTDNSLPTSFYIGDALNSLNSWARLISGLLAGFGIVWLAFPYIFQSHVLHQEPNKLNPE
jgi:uncharacterized membrane protein